MSNQRETRIFSAERTIHRSTPFDDGLPSGIDLSHFAGTGANANELQATLENFKAEMLEELREMLGIPPETEDELTETEVELDVAQAEVQRLKEEQTLLKTEIRALSHAIEETKTEVAALYQSDDDANRMAVVQHELDSVVSATEDATGRILEAVEAADQAAHNIVDTAQDPYVKQLAEEISEQVTRVFEASNFQDLTGQRLNKVVNTLKYVEERVASVIEIWGEDEFAEAKTVAVPKGLDDLDKTVEKKFDNIERISQDDIDKMFD